MTPETESSPETPANTPAGKGLASPPCSAPPHKEFILFQYDQYYPVGGMCDMVGSFDSQKDAKLYALENRRDYGEIVNRDTWEVVEEID